MADPVTAGVMAAVSIGGTIAGSLTKATGDETAAAAASQSYQYKAGVALLNKQIDLQNSRWALDAGDIQAEESGLKSRSEISQTKANQGASGLDVATGSNAQVTDSQENVAKFDQDVIRWNAAKTAYGYQTKAMGEEAEANLDVASAGYAKTAGDIAAAGSFISGATSVASKWSQAKTTGMFGNSDTAFEQNLIS